MRNPLASSDALGRVEVYDQRRRVAFIKTLSPRKSAG
jgi:hypothetical protein